MNDDDDEMKEIYEPQCCGMVSRQIREFSKKRCGWELGRKSICLSWDEHKEKAFTHKA